MSKRVKPKRLPQRELEEVREKDPDCQSARNRDPGSACNRDPSAGEVGGAGVVDAEP